jgi:hypothetical protein
VKKWKLFKYNEVDQTPSLMLGWFNRRSRVISTRVVNGPLKTRRERGLVSRLLFTFRPGGFGGSYFYLSYYLISVKHHKVKNFKRYRLCFFNLFSKLKPNSFQCLSNIKLFLAMLQLPNFCQSHNQYSSSC